MTPQQIQAMNERVRILEEALQQIADLPFVTEETPWTWSDISKKQTYIARVALEDNVVIKIDKKRKAR